MLYKNCLQFNISKRKYINTLKIKYLKKYFKCKFK